MNNATTATLINPPPHAAPLSPPDKHGVVYTRPWVVELILDLAGYRAEANLVDAFAIEPATGDGAFLVPMARQLLASCRRQGRPLAECRTSLLALELDPAAAAAAQQLVCTALVDGGATHEEAVELAEAWVRVGDALLEVPRLPPADFVIGNPPYIRLEDVDEATMARYRATYRTTPRRMSLDTFGHRLRDAAPPYRPARILCGAADQCAAASGERRWQGASADRGPRPRSGSRWRC